MSAEMTWRQCGRCGGVGPTDELGFCSPCVDALRRDGKVGDHVDAIADAKAAVDAKIRAAEEVALDYAERLLMVLTKAEWAASAHIVEPINRECPDCRMREFRGHAPDCALDAIRKPLLAAYRARRGIPNK